AQDTHIAGYADQAGRAIVLVVNKWDLVPKGLVTKANVVEQLRDRLPFLEHAPVCFTSAVRGDGVRDLFGTIDEVAAEFGRRVGAMEVTETLRTAIERRPVSLGGVPLVLQGASQVSAAPAGSPVAALAPGRRVPRPDAAGRIVVPVASRASRQARLEEIPPGWTLKEFAGRASVEVVRAETGAVLSLRSMHASFALYRDVIADLREFPLLSWSWKVVRLPAAGDVRHAVTDDEAAQVYVIFPRWPLPFTNS